MWELTIDRIAGIRSGTTRLHEGANIVQASNFQGKSSFVSAIQTVLGATGLDAFGDQHPLMEGAKSGSVTLETPDGRYTVELHREDDTVVRRGDPYLTSTRDRHGARLFALLGEDNPVRAAVRAGDDARLTELLKLPLDLEDIDRQIERLRIEIGAVEEHREQATSAADELATVRARRDELDDRLANLRERRDDLEAAHDQGDDARDLREALSDRQSALERVERRLRRHDAQLDRLRAERETTQAARDDLTIPEGPAADSGKIREQLESVDHRLDLIEEVYSANRRVLQEGALSTVTTIEHDLAGDSASCWVCGSDADIAAIDAWLDHLDEHARTLRTERTELARDLDTIEERRTERRRAEQRRSELEDRVDELTLEIDEHRERLATLREERETLRDEVDRLEAEYTAHEEAEDGHGEELKAVHVELGRLEAEVDRHRDRIETLEAQASERDRLESELERLRDELEHAKNRKESKLSELVEQFDTAVDELLRRFEPGFDGARLDRKRASDGSTYFELVIARDGRESRLEHLSEGERELVGLAIALAGHRTYNIGELVPCVVVDGIGQLAAEHIHSLVEHLEQSAPILVTTAYPEAGSFDGTTISPSAWDVVSRGPGAA